jgi:hypothetical protein
MAVLLRLAALIERDAEALAVPGVRNNGTGIGMPQKAEPLSAAQTFRGYAEELDKLYGEIAPTAESVLGLFHREPAGGGSRECAVELLPDDWRVEGGPGPGCWQSGGPEAGRDGVLDPAALGRICAGGGLPARVLNVVTRPGAVSGVISPFLTGCNRRTYAAFASEIGESWSASDKKYDETWYRRLVAKVIVFRTLEKAVPRQEWNPGGYRANVVIYAIAKLVDDLDQLDMLIDLDQVWARQHVTKELLDALPDAAEVAADVITAPENGIKKFTVRANPSNPDKSIQRSFVLFVTV